MLIPLRRRRQATDGAGGFFGIDRISNAGSLRTVARGLDVGTRRLTHCAIIADQATAIMLTICRWHPPREIRGAATCLAGTPFTAGLFPIGGRRALK
jgi:hypothetical protein